MKKGYSLPPGAGVIFNENRIVGLLRSFLRFSILSNNVDPLINRFAVFDG